MTSSRRQAVDFTPPFMTLGISILFSKPPTPPTDLFSFLSPFSLDVWIYMGSAYLFISLLFVRIGSDGARRLGKPSSLQGTRRSGEHMVDYEHYMALDRLIDGARLWHSAEVRGYYIGIILCYRSIIFQSCLNSVGHWNVVVLRSNDAEFLHG